MKVLVFYLVVLANFSHIGKASVDSYLPANDNLFLKDTTKDSDKSCHRACKLNVKPRRCAYKFKIEPTFDVDDKASITINGLIPGPPINVCMNDIVVVEVENKVPNTDMAIHWHGINQLGTPYMDGVPMITQCPIPFGSKYKYAFRASSPGTYFYHADSVSQQSDGVFGALIVNQMQPLEPHSGLYDYDRTEENTLLFSAVFPSLLTGSLNDNSEVKPDHLNINGNVDATKIFVMEGYSHRLRLINSIAVDCPVVFNVGDHEMTVIASDGKPVKPVTTRDVMLYPGERMDVVVKASKPPSGYWMKVRGVEGQCSGLHASAMFIYSGYNYTSMLQERKEHDIEEYVLPQSVIYGQILKSLTNVNESSEIRRLYLGINRIMSNKEVINDYRYLSDAMVKTPFVPAPLSTRKNGVVAINGKNFLYPNAPILLRPKDISKAILCPVGEEEKHEDPQCLQILTAKKNDVIELVLINEGKNSNDSYIFHLHGCSMQVMSTWKSEKGTPITKQQVLQMEEDGKIQRNIVDPPVKDNIVVPNKGYTVVRITLRQPGAWLLECRSCGMNSLPTGFLINVPQQLPKTILNTLPTCGNYRPPDVLLN